MSGLTELLAGIERLEGPSTGMDIELMRLVDPDAVPYSSAHLRYTSSVDAALDLVERMTPGCKVELFYGGPIVGHHCHLFRVEAPQAAGKSRDASTLPLAILAALLKAMIDHE